MAKTPSILMPYPQDDSEDEESTRNMTPKEVVAQLDRNIIGQADAKRAVANALRNRWRRKQLATPMRVPFDS